MDELAEDLASRDTFEFNLEEKDSIIVKRQFLGRTQRDIIVDELPMPVKPVWRRAIIFMLRLYRRKLSKRLGNRCVFDPSCSRYSEMVFRERNFIKATILTVQRLYRCRPNNGGVDEP